MFIDFGVFAKAEAVILFPVQMSAWCRTQRQTTEQLKVCLLLDCLGLSFLFHLDVCYPNALHLCLLICKVGMLMPPRGVVAGTKCTWSHMGKRSVSSAFIFPGEEQRALGPTARSGKEGQ